MKHGGDVLVEMLIGYGVPVVFGLAGGQTLPLYDAIRSRAPRIKHIPMRDERNAAYAADGYARISGRVGVCDATVGPGAIKFTSGLAEAYNSSIPIVALISDMPSDWLAVRYRGGGNQLVDQMSVLAPLCKWTGRLPAPHKLPELVQRAFQFSTSGRPGPVAIELPEDMFKAECDEMTHEIDARYGSAPAHRFAPDPEAVRAAIGLLQSAARPVMIVGGGAHLSSAGEQASALAEALAIPVATTLSGKGVIPENHPLSLGVIGSLGGSSVARTFLEEADVILAVGFKFGQNPTFKWTLPKQGQRVIHLDIDGAEIGKVFPAEVGLVADAREGLSALCAARTTSHSMDSVAKQIAEQKKKWRKAGLQGYQTTVLLTNALLHGGTQSRERFHFIVHRPELSIPAPYPTVFPSVNEVIGDLADRAVFLGEAEPLVPNHVVEREKDKYNVVFPELQQGERWNDAAERLLSRGVETGRGRFISYRLIGDVPCGTIADVNALIHPTQSRHLTVREGARLCGYPDDFVFAVDVKGRAQASDVTQAVLPTMGEYLGGICARSLDNNDAQPGELNVIDFRPLARVQLRERKEAWKSTHSRG